MNLTLLGFLIFTGSYALAAAVPGPGVAAVVAHALAFRTRGLAAFIFGITLGDMVWFLGAVFGLLLVVERFAIVFVAVRWLGAAYLVYLAVNLWSADVGLKFDEIPNNATLVTEAKNPPNVFFSGLMLCLGNPKAMVFFLALMPSALPVGTLNFVDVAVLLMMMLVILPTVMGSYAAMALQAHKTGSHNFTRYFGKSAAIVMCAAALMVVLV